MQNLLISAAEPSGDHLAAELVTALRSHRTFRARGVAGPAMRDAGVEPLARVEDIAVMGLAEVFSRLPAIRRASRAMRAAIDEGADALIVIDAPDFHLPLAHRARRLGIAAIGYVSPQVWAWRRKRVGSISRALDHLLCLFDFEPALYPQLDAKWVGHPVRDRMPHRGTIDPDTYGLLPGSRRQEVQRMLPVFLETARRIRSQQPGAQFLLAVPDLNSPDDDLGSLPEWVHRVSSSQAMRGVRAALTKSGTITLELAVMGVPQVVAHRVHPLTWWVGRLLVRGIRHIAMPNILAARSVVPEHVQHLDPEILAKDVLALPTQQPVELEALGPPGGADRAAQAIVRILERHTRDEIR